MLESIRSTVLMVRNDLLVIAAWNSSMPMLSGSFPRKMSDSGLVVCL